MRPLKIIIDKVAADTGYPKVVCKEIIDSCFKNMPDLIRKHGKLNIQEFGTFSTRVLPERTRMNFQKMKRELYPEKEILIFKFHPNVKYNRK